MIELSESANRQGMRNSLTATDREALPAIFAAVLADEGATRGDIQRVTGCPNYRVRKVLCELRKQGRLSHVAGVNGRETRWYSPEKAAVVRKEFDRISAKNRRDSKVIYARNYNERVRLAKRKAYEEDDEDDISNWPIVHRAASVCDPLPFVCNASSSIFRLAASL